MTTHKAKMKPLTVVAFRRWLLAQKSSRRFTQRHSNKCPLAAYMGRSASVGVLYAYDSNSIFLPNWARLFISLFDGNESQPRSFGKKHALALLDVVAKAKE
jgi:hypothetical protein